MRRFIKWLLDYIFGRATKVKIQGAEKEAKDEVDKIPDGDSMSDFLND